MASFISQRLLDKPFPLYHPDDASQLIHHSVQFQNMSIEGEKPHCLISISNVSGALKRENMMETQARKITEQHEFLKGIFKASRDVLITINNDGEILSRNAVFEQYFPNNESININDFLPGMTDYLKMSWDSIIENNAFDSRDWIVEAPEKKQKQT